ncbi:MAG: 2Fe-2S iron-sulfur cluster binding domain-containing protein [Mogibacterium sp.]|nr:2Fe-2S iron-sulfur cluster binding domain-containing protein [Mogibacterium sp.]
MAFKRSNVPGEDIKLAMEMTAKRRQLIDEAPATPLVYEYGVNRLAKALHPGFVKAVIAEKAPCSADCVKIVMEPADSGEFPYFRAGQFITLSCRAGDSFLSRPYSIISSPKEALAGKLEIMVQRKGIFSTFLIDEAPVGTGLWLGEPSGDFHHDSIRDRNHILAIAGGSGVTPFLSMMKAIREGSEDFRITLIYGARTRAHIPFDPEEFRGEGVDAAVVLSEEEAEGYMHGFITADLLKKYIDGDTSVFMCGPDAMYRFVSGELETLGFDYSRIRQERNSVGDRKVDEIKVFRLIVHIRDAVYELEAPNNETLITALERAGIPAVVRCRNGSCGFCHSRVVNGEYFIDLKDDFRRSADKKFNYIHPCSTYPESDMEIDIPIMNP